MDMVRIIMRLICVLFIVMAVDVANAQDGIITTAASSLPSTSAAGSSQFSQSSLKPTFSPQSVTSPELLNELSRIRIHFQTLTNAEKLTALDKITANLKLAPDFVAQLLYKTPLPVPVSTPTTTTNISISEDIKNLNSSQKSTSIEQSVLPSISTPVVSPNPLITSFVNNGSSSTSTTESHAQSRTEFLNTTPVPNNNNESAQIQLKSQSDIKTVESLQNHGQHGINITVPIYVVLRVPPPGNHHPGSNVTETNIDNGFGALRLNNQGGDATNNYYYHNDTTNGTQEETSSNEDFDDDYWKDKVDKLVTDIGERCNIIYC